MGLEISELPFFYLDTAFLTPTGLLASAMTACFLSSLYYVGTRYSGMFNCGTFYGEAPLGAFLCVLTFDVSFEAPTDNPAPTGF